MDGQRRNRKYRPGSANLFGNAAVVDITATGAGSCSSVVDNGVTLEIGIPLASGTVSVECCLADHTKSI
jgi:hypothetical protein